MRAAKGEGSLFTTTDGGYRGYVTVNGKRKYFSAKTKREAAQKKRELLNRKDGGTLVTGRAPSVATWMRRWLEAGFASGDFTRRTYSTNKAIVEKSIIPEFGTVPITNLTREQIEDWLAATTLKPSSKRRYLAPLKTALNDAVDRGVLGLNPALKVTLPALGKRDTSSYSTVDRDVILAAAKGYNAARWHIGLRFGPRPGEVLGLTWPDFDEAEGSITIRHQLLYAPGFGLYLEDAAKTEAGTDRVLYLPGYMVELLKEQRTLQLQKMAQLGDEWQGWEYEGKPVALIFTQDNGRAIQTRMDTERWHNLLASVGLKDERRYKGRHTGATHLLTDTGGDVAAVADILGHADAGFTLRTYVHPLDEKKRILAKTMNAPYAAPYESTVEPDEAKVEGL